VVGSTVNVVTVPRNASGKPLGAGRTVLIGTNGGTATTSPSAVTFSAADSSYRATLTGVTAGTTVVYGGIGTTPFGQSASLRVVSLPVVVPPVDTTPPPPPVSGVGKPQILNTAVGVCAAGNSCLFSGVRDVRLIGTAGTSFLANVRGIVGAYCAGFGFPNGYSIGTLLRCEYGPIKTVALTNPMPGMHGFQSTFLVPLGDTGSSVPQTQFTSFNGNPVQDGLGATRMKCELFRYAFDDPIVFPGQPGKAHLHAFFGNTHWPLSELTPQNIRTVSGGSTCQGGSLNRSAYWAPALIDTLTQEVIEAEFGQFYYKSGYGVDIRTTQTIPSGLVMIAGDKNGTGAKPSLAGSWACGQAFESHVIPTCAPGREYLEMAVSFPSCWNGRDLDSPDHISHMAYTSQTGPNTWSCPPGFRLIPKIDLLFQYYIRPGTDPRRWALVSDTDRQNGRGASAHADYMLGWDPATMLTLVTRCLNTGLDCGVGSIGNNIQLINRP
jgi:hypothetical protein